MIAMQGSAVITKSERNIQSIQGIRAAYATCTLLPVTDACVWEDRFATSPMFAMQTIFQPANEEELHTSFEHALDERIQATQRVSWEKTSSHKLPIHFKQKYQPFLASRGKAWQRLCRGITLICLALLFMMAGFDLMALLVLYTR